MRDGGAGLQRDGNCRQGNREQPAGSEHHLSRFLALRFAEHSRDAEKSSRGNDDSLTHDAVGRAKRIYVPYRTLKGATNGVSDLEHIESALLRTVTDVLLAVAVAGSEPPVYRSPIKLDSCH